MHSSNSPTPGTDVHHPVCAPHWVKNGSDYSVALSINFCMRSFDQRAKVYQINHYLRKLGLSPTPPGKSVWRDRLKIATLELISARNPKTKYELLRSGIKRVARPSEIDWQLKQQFINCR